MFFSPVVRSGSSPGSRGRCGASALRCSWHSWCLQHLRVQIWKWAFPRRSESRRQTKYGAVEAVPSSSLPTRGPSCPTWSLCAQGRRAPAGALAPGCQQPAHAPGLAAAPGLRSLSWCAWLRSCPQGGGSSCSWACGWRWGQKPASFRHDFVSLLEEVAGLGGVPACSDSTERRERPAGTTSGRWCRLPARPRSSHYMSVSSNDSLINNRPQSKDHGKALGEAKSLSCYCQPLKPGYWTGTL